jgi:hypothetical protein
VDDTTDVRGLASAFDPLGDLLGGGGLTAPAQPAGVVGYNKNGLAIYFHPVRDQANAAIVNVNCTFQNSSPALLSNFVFQAAVPKVWPWPAQRTRGAGAERS